MRRSLSIVVLAIVALCACAGSAHADGGQNAAEMTQAVKDGVSAAAPALFSGNWIAGVFGFLLAAVPAGLHILQRQAQDKWHLFNAQNHIDTARTLPAAPPAAP